MADGVNWQEVRHFSTTHGAVRIVHDNGLFVGVGPHGTIFTAKVK